jgi:hypothetical protein
MDNFPLLYKSSVRKRALKINNIWLANLGVAPCLIWSARFVDGKARPTKMFKRSTHTHSVMTLCAKLPLKKYIWVKVLIVLTAVT